MIALDACARSRDGPIGDLQRVILMDISLPVLDGWEATRRLKMAPETKSIPVIALTAHAMSGDREICIEAGCDDFDASLVEIARLVGKIEALLQDRKCNEQRRTRVCLTT